MKLPKHAASLHLSHNEHKNYYQTVAKSIEDEDHGYTDDCWINEEEKAKAIETNECWSCQWYPDTPVGFCIMSASTLGALLSHLEQIGQTEDF